MNALYEEMPDVCLIVSADSVEVPVANEPTKIAFSRCAKATAAEPVPTRSVLPESTNSPPPMTPESAYIPVLGIAVSEPRPLVVASAAEENVEPSVPSVASGVFVASNGATMDAPAVAV